LQLSICRALWECNQDRVSKTPGLDIDIPVKKTVVGATWMEISKLCGKFFANSRSNERRNCPSLTVRDAGLAVVEKRFGRVKGSWAWEEFSGAAQMHDLREAP
jgi:hypothetical protein